MGVLAQREGFRALPGTPAGDGEHGLSRGDEVGLDAPVRGGTAGAGGRELVRPGVHGAHGDDPGAVGGHGDVVPVAEGLVAGGGDDHDSPGHGQLRGFRSQGGGPVQILPGVPGAVFEAGVPDGGVDDLGAEAVGPLDGGHPAVLLDGQLALRGPRRGAHILGLGQQVPGGRRHPDEPARLVAGDDAEDAGAVDVLAVGGLLPGDRLRGLVADLVVAVDEVPGGQDPQAGEGGVSRPVEAGVDEGDAHPLAEEPAGVEEGHVDGGQLLQGGAVVEGGRARPMAGGGVDGERRGGPQPGAHGPHLAHEGEAAQAGGLAGSGVHAHGIEPARARPDGQAEGLDRCGVAAVEIDVEAGVRAHVTGGRPGEDLAGGVRFVGEEHPERLGGGGGGEQEEDGAPDQEAPTKDPGHLQGFAGRRSMISVPSGGVKRKRSSSSRPSRRCPLRM